MMAIKLTAWKYIDRAGDAEEVEALACADGLKLSLDWCPAWAVLATDCATLAALLQNQGVLRLRLKFTVDEVKLAGDGLLEWIVVDTKRETNRVAHELAQLAKRTRHSTVWRFAAPTCVDLFLLRIVKMFMSNKISLFLAKKKVWT